MHKHMRCTRHLVRAAALLMTAAGLAGCPGGSIDGLNLMGGGELLQGGAMVVGAAVEGIGSAVTPGAAETTAATAPSPSQSPEERSTSTYGPGFPASSVNVGANAVVAVGVRGGAGTGPAIASCRAECPDGARLSIGCPAGQQPVCQCEKKPYAACAVTPAPAAAEAASTAAVRTRN